LDGQKAETVASCSKKSKPNICPFRNKQKQSLLNGFAIVVLFLHRNKYSRLQQEIFTSTAIKHEEGNHGGASPKNTLAFTRANDTLAKS